MPVSNTLFLGRIDLGLRSAVPLALGDEFSKLFGFFVAAAARDYG